MPKRRANYRLVKINRSYTVEEVAQRLDIHKNTVRGWLRAGLQAIDRSRPILIHGGALSEFLKERRDQKKRPCEPNEMYCLRCRATRVPAGNMADYIPSTTTLGNLKGFCPVCDSWMFRRASLWSLDRIRRILDVQFVEA